ncbi:substrate-binding periplasmic protein [Pseudomonas sp. FEN]|uniref:substrate-binding periplasmic protein n=1 Tax=Pseudomonas sp. FEN TaxID=2767468 RepID=UPI00174D87F0|nr:ABC transporter substrate-binding protein [Pseudomonas sp. FEN]
MSQTTRMSNSRTTVLYRRFLWLSLLLACSAHGAALPVDLFILDAPPLTLVDSAKGHGIVGDAALMAIARVGYVAHIQALPWARSQKYVSEKQDLLIAPLSRTPEREDRFTWIAPIMTMDRAFFSLEHRVSSYAEAKKVYRVIGVGLGSAQEEILRTQGFSHEQIYPLTIGDNPAQMLLKGRIDAWFNGVPESEYIWPKVSRRKLLMSPVMSTVDLYLACSKQCSAELVQGLREAIEALRSDGTLARIRKSYLSQ